MADNLKIDVDFTGKGSEKVNIELNKVTMNAKELEKELKLLANEYGTLAGSMHVLKQAGLENTKEFKQLSTASAELKTKIDTLGKEYQNAGEKTKLFREKAVNLGADLTILSFGLKSAASDLGDVRAEMQKANPDIQKVIGSLGSATLSLLAMIPALKAVGSILPATFTAGAVAIGTTTAALSLFAAGVTLLVKQVEYTISIFSRLGDVLTGVTSQAEFANENIRLMTFGLVDLNNASDDFDSSNVQQQLSDIAYIANFAYNALNDLKASVQGALEMNLEKFRRSGQTLDPVFTEDDLKKQTQELKRVNAPKKTSVGSKKSIKETTELLKNLGKEAFSVSGALLRVAQLDLSNFQPIVMADEITILRQRVVEETNIMRDALSGFAESSITAMGNFFGSLVPPQDALSPFNQFVKSIALSFINSVQAMIFAAGGAASAKGITTFGISLITDLPLLAAAWTALEAAKGFIGSFADGSDVLRLAGNRSSDSGIARVSNGEMIMNARAVSQNLPTLQAMQRGGSMQGDDSGVFISADVAGFLKIHKKATKDLRQLSKWKRF